MTFDLRPCLVLYDLSKFFSFLPDSVGTVISFFLVL